MVTLAALLAQTSVVILATTTSTRDARTARFVAARVRAANPLHREGDRRGQRQALAMGRRGDADVVLSHAPDAERALVDSGYFVRRRLVMHNEFLIVGPAREPGRAAGLSDPVAAVRSIAERRALFVSAGRSIGHAPARAAVLEARGLLDPASRRVVPRIGQGMGATLQLADEKQATPLTDRATYLTWRDKLQLVPMVEGDSLLLQRVPRVGAQPEETRPASTWPAARRWPTSWSLPRPSG